MSAGEKKRPNLYERQIAPNLHLVEKMARGGLPQKQIAEALRISHRTLSLYINKYPELKKAMDAGREIAVIDLEDALFKRATGYREKVQKAVKVRKGYNEEIVIVEEEAYFPPDVTAAIFLLKNWGRSRHYASEPTAVELHQRELEMKEKMMTKDEIAEEEKVIIINDLNADD